MTVPTTIDEAVQALMDKLSLEDKAAITRMSEDETSDLHHGLGRWIRNNWGLWQGGPLKDHMMSLGFTHPDDMSGSIIREFWARLNKLPSKIAEDVEYYKEFWAKSRADNQ